MSTLWTPSGEHHVPRAPAAGDAGSSQSGGQSGGGAGRPPSGAPAAAAAATAAGTVAEPTDDEIREAEAEVDAVREQLLNAPAEAVISNHALGLWQLAALHLSAQPPHLQEAQLAIDALASLLEGLQGRLGEDEKTLADGLTQLRMAFVQIANAERSRQGAGTG